jgi:hypothetical protein
VQHQHRQRVAQTFVNVVQQQGRALLDDLVVVRCERVVGQVGETRVWGTQDFHRFKGQKRYLAVDL